MLAEQVGEGNDWGVMALAHLRVVDRCVWLVVGLRCARTPFACGGSALRADAFAYGGSALRADACAVSQSVRA